MVNPQKIEKTFCYKTFGKSFRELNEQEKKEFYRLQKAKNRAELPELKEKESEYQKNYRSNNRERLNTKQRNNYHNNVGRYRQYGNYCRIKKRGYVEPHAQSLTRQMFGVELQRYLRDLFSILFLLLYYR